MLSKCLDCCSFRAVEVPQEPAVLFISYSLVFSSINPDSTNTLRKDYSRSFGPTWGALRMQKLRHKAYAKLNKWWYEETDV